MSSELYVLTTSIVSILLTIVGFFLKRVLDDVKRLVDENGKNKGRIELVEQQQVNDARRIEVMTRLELKVMNEKVNIMTEKIGDLAKNVQILVFEKKNNK